jgi:hypothetical protein
VVWWYDDNTEMLYANEQLEMHVYIIYTMYTLYETQVTHPHRHRIIVPESESVHVLFIFEGVVLI